MPSSTGFGLRWSGPLSNIYRDEFERVARRAFSMWNRDPASPSFGSFDRQYWGWKYKDFGDMFTKTSMSPETREVMNSLADNIYGDLVNTVAKGRRQSPDAIRATLGWYRDAMPTPSSGRETRSGRQRPF